MEIVTFGGHFPDFDPYFFTNEFSFNFDTEYKESLSVIRDLKGHQIDFLDNTIERAPVRDRADLYEPTLLAT